MNYEFAIVGGGIVGCAILNKLTRMGQSCVLIEKGCDVANGSSKANSGLVHAGFDAKPNTLKARFNVRGNRLYPKICKRLHIELKKIGSLVVGDDIEKLKSLKEQGRINKVKNLSIINSAKLQKLVPNINKERKYALYAKNAYIVSPYNFTIALCEEAILNGAKAEMNFDTKTIKRVNGFYEIISADDRKIRATNIINCAGVGYNDIANILKSEIYKIEFRRGEYFVLDSSVYDFTKITVFPLPTEKTKGVLVTPTADGNILVGPTSYESDSSVETTKEGLQYIKANVSMLFDNIPFDKTIRIFSGVRNIVGKDFIIEKSIKKPNVVNVAGICSPGLTSSPAIAEYVASLFGLYKEKKHLIRRRKRVVTKTLSDRKLNKLIAKNSNYGIVVCRCENITKGEIIDAINSPLRPISVDAIKRRARAGMGRCQGGFCFDKVIKILAKENKMSELIVPKENYDSNFFVCDINEEVEK